MLHTPLLSRSFPPLQAAVRAAAAAAADGDEPIYLSDDDEEAAAHAAAVAVAQRQHRSAAAGGGGGHAGDDPPIDLPDGIDAEEARMLEAAMLGVPYGGRIPDWGAEAAARDARAASAAAAAADPASLASRALVQEQDAAYQASLAVDRVKEEERVAVAAAVAAEAAAAATATRAAAAAAAQAAEAGASRVAAAAACLPTEPEPGTPGALSVAVRLPDGTRLTRRFHPATDRVGHLFAWVVSSSPASPPPRAFRLVSSYPRRVLEEPEGMGGGPSLAEAGFAGGGSEALMVEAV